jgi:10 TM Acyl Transferase domain found in Cas1p
MVAVLQSASGTAPLSTMASAMLFGTIMFATVALAVNSWSHGDLSKTLQAANHPRATALDVRSFSSVFTLLFQSCMFGLILFYAYLCEYHPPYPHSSKSYNRDEFFFMTALLFVVSFYTLKKNDPKVGLQSSAAPSSASAMSAQPDKLLGSTKQQDGGVMNGGSTVGGATMVAAAVDPYAPRAVAPVNDKTEVLSRDQTEEWKGWMQFMFLLYHYYHAEEVYNAIRVMITCYVWYGGKHENARDQILNDGDANFARSLTANNFSVWTG